jgi:hypothetical protein
MKTGFCPQCRQSTVVKIKQFGTFPRCRECLEKNHTGRLERQRIRRSKNNVNGHKNKTGKRYPNQAVPQDVVCCFCNTCFVLSKKPNGRPTCESCYKKRQEERRKKHLGRVKKLYWKNPGDAKRKRLSRTLSAIGLSIEWYDSLPKECGICKTTDPGEKGWCLDHDHKCCPLGVRSGCLKCVRGILCSNCNRGLGHFKDNPELFRSAVKWLEKGTAAK